VARITLIVKRRRVGEWKSELAAEIGPFIVPRIGTREARERSSHTTPDIEEASLQSRNPEYALYIIMQCLSQVRTYPEDPSCGLIAHFHVLLNQHHCQLWYQNGNDIVD
jgi:hypothetical protein